MVKWNNVNSYLFCIFRSKKWVFAYRFCSLKFVLYIINVFTYLRKQGFRKKGIERNLLAKKFIQKILYSKQSIEIALFYPVKNKVFNRVYTENPQDFQKLPRQNNPALACKGWAEKFSETRASSRLKGLETTTSPIASENRELMHEVGLGKYFDGAFFSAHLGHTKAEPAFFKKIIRQLKVNPDEIIFWDDKQKNVEVAKNLGIRAFLFEGADKLRQTLQDNQII